jgi:hypothetical protein
MLNAAQAAKAIHSLAIALEIPSPVERELAETAVDGFGPEPHDGVERDFLVLASAVVKQIDLEETVADIKNELDNLYGILI